MARTTARPPAPKWPWIVGGVVVVALIIAAVFVFTRSSGNDQPVSSPAATSTGAPDGAEAPTGCLGGDKRDAAMVLAAQKAAPDTSAGAVEFAAAMQRFLYQYPYPTADDAVAATNAVMAKDAETRDLAAFFATNPNISGGLVPDGQSYYRSTIPGVWHLESYSNNQAVVSIGTGVVIDGKLNTTIRGSITVTVVWEDGAWKFLTSSGTRTTEELYSVGTPFTAGC